MMHIRHAATAAEINAIHQLFQEYAAWLKVDLCFQGFGNELASLPGEYAPPQGRLLLATFDQRPAGCVALRHFDEHACEIKRLFVREAYRSGGLGRRLAENVIADAQSIGYSKVLLDTLPFMTAAIRLYESVGFVRRTAYYESPLADTVYMELEL